LCVLRTLGPSHSRPADLLSRIARHHQTLLENAPPTPTNPQNLHRLGWTLDGDMKSLEFLWKKPKGRKKIIGFSSGLRDFIMFDQFRPTCRFFSHCLCPECSGIPNVSVATRTGQLFNQFMHSRVVIFFRGIPGIFCLLFLRAVGRPLFCYFLLHTGGRETLFMRLPWKF